LTAQALLSALSTLEVLAFTAQILNEFSSVMMRSPRGPRLQPQEVREIVRELAATGAVLSLTGSATELGLDAMPSHRLSFWDALLWATAKQNGIAVIYTEDFQDGREIEGVRFQNPFLVSP